MLEVTGHTVLLCSWRYALLKSSNLSFALSQGCKWQMQQLRQYLTAKHGFETVQTLFKEIDNIFIRSLLSVQKTIINDKHCFELYGYDILLDQDLKPWECFIFDCLVWQDTYQNWMKVGIAWLKKMTAQFAVMQVANWSERFTLPHSQQSGGLWPKIQTAGGHLAHCRHGRPVRFNKIV